jgi:SsrA-binding protein
MSENQPVIRVLLENRRARFEFTLLDTFEAGIALLGGEVKSLRGSQANVQEAFVQLKRDGAWLHGLHISPWPFVQHDKPEPLRPRRLLLHESELAKLDKAVRQKGMTLVPVRIYLKGSRIKVEVAIAKGKKLHDKRATMKERDAKRDLARER